MEPTSKLNQPPVRPAGKIPIKLAGKSNPARILSELSNTIENVAKNKAVFIPATAALAGGASLAGNALNSEEDPKPTQRVIAEALASAAGGALGAVGMNALANAGRAKAKLREDIGVEKNFIREEAKKVGEPNISPQLADARMARLLEAKQNLANLREGRTIANAANAIGVPLGMAGAATIGGLAVGGAMNVAGVPQMQEVKPALASDSVQQYLAGLQMENAMMQSGGAMYA
jgi:hypothetical protein